VQQKIRGILVNAVRARPFQLVLAIMPGSRPTPRERADFHTTTSSRNECGFDDYAVWGWDEKSIPMFSEMLGHAHRFSGMWLCA